MKQDTTMESFKELFDDMKRELLSMEQRLGDKLEKCCSSPEQRIGTSEQKTEEPLISLEMSRAEMEHWRPEAEKNFEDIKLVASASSTIYDDHIFYEVPIFDEETTFDEESSDTNIGMPSTCSTKCHLVVDITGDVVAAYRLIADMSKGVPPPAEIPEVTSPKFMEDMELTIPSPAKCLTKCLNLWLLAPTPESSLKSVRASSTYTMTDSPPSNATTTYISVIFFDGPTIILDAGLCAYWMGVTLMLETNCDVCVVKSWLFLLDWFERQPWPPPLQLMSYQDGAVQRPLPWPSFFCHKVSEKQQFGLENEEFRSSRGNISGRSSESGFGQLQGSGQGQRAGQFQGAGQIQGAGVGQIDRFQHTVEQSGQHQAAREYQGTDYRAQGRLPKLQLPQFNGEYPKLWQSRCETYFAMYQVDTTMWVKVAAMHFAGVAARWVQSTERRISHCNWSEFCGLMLQCFGRDLPRISSQQRGVVDIDTRKEEKHSEDFLAVYCTDEILYCGTNARSATGLITGVEAMDMPLLNAYLDAVGDPSFRTGVNFAQAGCSITPANPTSVSPFSFGFQIKQFFAFKDKVTKLLSKGDIYRKYIPQADYFSQGLYMFDIGQNDLAGELYSKTEDQVAASIPTILLEFETGLKKLYDQGARKFWIHNTGPLGCLPQNIAFFGKDPSQLDGLHCVAKHNRVAKLFNLQLHALCTKLRGELAGASITYVDVYTIKYSLIANYSRYGFENPTQACCGYGGPPLNYDSRVPCGQTVSLNGNPVTAKGCSDSTEYVNWDGIHYTEAANFHIASQILTGKYSDPPFIDKMPFIIKPRF